MTHVVVAGGRLPRVGRHHIERLLDDADQVIAADGGLVHVVERGRWPDVLIGDLDSAPADLVESARARGVTIVEVSADKDMTDLELALDAAVDRGATRLCVVAMFGGRLDHELSNVALLASERYADLDVLADDGRRTLYVVRRRLQLTEPFGTTITLIPWASHAEGVTTRGLRWPLHGDRLRLGTTRGVSNLASEIEQHVELRAGTLLVIVDRSESAGGVHLD